MTLRFPVPIASVLIHSVHRCSSCNHVDSALFVDIVEFPFHFQCPNCGGMTKEPEGPFTPVYNTDEHIRVIICDALSAAEEAKVKSVRKVRFDS